MVLVVGVDGCPTGWLAVVYDLDRKTLSPTVLPNVGGILAAYPDAATISIDIPIGLAEGMPRRCDVEARRVLGPRRNSVFPAPDPRVIESRTYEDASALSRSLTANGVSRQAFAIYPKVAEVNAMMTPILQQRVIEVHPEVCFWALAGERPMDNPKRTPQGFEERRALLSEAFDEIRISSREEARRFARPAGTDDVLDAIVAAWMARRYAEGRAGRLPPDPDVDSRGLRMEMVF
jgi:predicted RNase H-like nuclease